MRFLGVVLALFGILMISSCGGGSGSSSINVTPPSAPSGVSITADVAKNTITWTSADSTTYNLYWSTTAAFQNGTVHSVANVTSPYVHANLTPGTTYYYRLTSVKGGLESTPAAEVSGKPMGTAPGAPQSPTLTTGQYIQLSWPSVSGATGYKVYWATTQGVTKNTTTYTTVTGPSYTQQGVVQNSTYYYAVCAVNEWGESDLSAEVSGKLAAWYDVHNNYCASGNPAPGCDFYSNGNKVIDLEDPYYHASYNLSYGWWSYHDSYGYPQDYIGWGWLSPDNVLYDDYGRALN